MPIAAVGCWYSALIFALTSVSSATQQAITLNRLSTYSNGLTRIRLLLAAETESEQADDGHDARHKRPSLLQLYVWQTPIMFLNFSILLYIAGLMALVFQVATQQWGNVHEKWGIVSLRVPLSYACPYLIIGGIDLHCCYHFVCHWVHGFHFLPL
jgi:hypothetical protein